MRFQPQSLTPDRSARHFFGSELRRLRETSGMSLTALAKIVSSSKSTLARVETAELMPPPDLPATLDVAFGLDGFFARLHGLARREAHPDQYRRFMDFEAEATDVENYVAQVIPGPLQTEGYARALLRCQDELSDEQVEERVSARLSRAGRSSGPSAQHRWAVLDEAVLRRPVGGEAVMMDQLARLLENVETAHCKVQVLPYAAGAHPLLGGSLTLLTLKGRDAVAYEEGIEAGHLYEDASAVQRRRRQYDVLRANALSLADSAEFIREVLKERKSCENSST